MKNNTIYHTAIKTETVCKNGSERFGAKAICKFSFKPNAMPMEVTIEGKTKLEAEQKMLKFLNSDKYFKLSLIEEKVGVQS
jgi:hypothetical protein